MRYQEYFKILLCAWILWIEYSSIGIKKTYERRWIVETAYPEEGYSQCIQDMKTLVTRKVERKKNHANVKSVERTPLIGNREDITTELKSGGSYSEQYVCLPDTVKPE
jgi:hypothetical protein